MSDKAEGFHGLTQLIHANVVDWLPCHRSRSLPASKFEEWRRKRLL